MVVGQPARRTRGEGENVTSKSSSGQLVRKSRGQGSGHKIRGSKYVSPTQKSKPKGKPGRRSKAPKSTSSSRFKSGPGFR